MQAQNPIQTTWQTIFFKLYIYAVKQTSETHFSPLPSVASNKKQWHQFSWHMLYYEGYFQKCIIMKVLTEETPLDLVLVII